MRGWIDYLQTAVEGFEEFASAYKLLPLIIGVIIYLSVRGNKEDSKKTKLFLLYVIVVMVLLLVPVTVVFFLMYQTRFYDYGWVWSFVPLTAVLAWGIIEIIWEELPQTCVKSKKGFQIAGRYMGVVAAVAVLWICGNQGRIQEVSEEVEDQQAVAEAVLQYLEDTDEATQSVIWGPKVMMQYLRSHSGEIALHYGKDMWDAKSGAYDYEAYTEEEIACYNWMELLSDERNLYLLEINQAPEHVHEALAEGKYIKTALKSDVNCMILPDQITPWMERKMRNAAAENGMTVSTAQVAEYVLWLFE